MLLQTLADSRAADYMKGRKTLEINPEHPIVQALKQKVDSDSSGAQVRQRSCKRPESSLSDTCKY